MTRALCSAHTFVCFDPIFTVCCGPASCALQVDFAFLSPDVVNPAWLAKAESVHTVQVG
jgi:hypothetical protein